MIISPLSFWTEMFGKDNIVLAGISQNLCIKAIRVCAFLGHSGVHLSYLSPSQTVK